MISFDNVSKQYPLGNVALNEVSFQIEDNEFVLLFMKVAILQQKSKFGYLYKFNSERMANTGVMLPVDESGNPDYTFMEQYVKRVKETIELQYLQGKMAVIV